MKYVHTNIIAKDSENLIHFYKGVFDCQSIDQKRDLKGPHFDALTGIKDVNIVGEHLWLPGYNPNGRHLCAVYARDCEGNIVEIMNWSKTL